MGESVVGERAARRAMSEIVGTVISDGSGVYVQSEDLCFLAVLDHSYRSVNSKYNSADAHMKTITKTAESSKLHKESTEL